MILSLLLVLAATPVGVTLDGCSFSADEVKRLAELELRKGPPRVLPVTLHCDAHALLVTVEDPVTQKTLVRAFPRDEVPAEAPERFAALAATELVEASWSELLLPSRPAVSKEDRAAAVEVLPTQRVRLVVFGLVRGLPEGALVQGGGGLRAHFGLNRLLGVALDLTAESGSRAVSGGRLGVDAFSLSAALTARREFERFTVLGGLGLRGFGERLAGTPSDRLSVEGRTLSGVLLGPDVLGEVSAALGPLDVSLAVEAGWLLNGLEARFDGVVVGQVSGPWVQACLGLGWRW